MKQHFTSSVCLFYAIAPDVQLYHGGDIMYDMRRRKPEPTPLPTQEMFKVPQHKGMILEVVAFDDAVSYRQWRNGL